MATYQDRGSPRGTDVALLRPPRLPFDARVGESFGIDRAGWKALVEAIFPTAKDPGSVALALAYCKSRNLDIFKKPVHIVPMWDSAQKRMIETVWPSIVELRITAHRTGLYAGCDEAVYGPMITQTFEGVIKDKDGKQRTVKKEITYPEWARITVYKLLNGNICKFVGPKVKWIEAYATIGQTDVPNDMWTDRPEGQLEKCAEAGALRRAFPEELGNVYAAEEMEGKSIGMNLAPEPLNISSVTNDLPKRRLTLEDVATGAIDATPVYEQQGQIKETSNLDRARPQSQRDQEATEVRLQAPVAPPSPSITTAQARDLGYEAYLGQLGPKGYPKDFVGKSSLITAWQKGYAQAERDENQIDDPQEREAYD